MEVKRSQQFRKHWKYWLSAGLLTLVGLVLWVRMKNDPAAVIKREFRRAGLTDQLIAWWTAIAKHETANFTSRVFRDSNNLFSMKLAGKNTTAIGALPYGERQAIFRSVTDSAKDQILFMTRRWNYPKDFASLEQLISYMKARNYFEQNEADYLAAVKQWMKQTG